ncbi:MAG TPA: helix-turn-helix transcriptional regulator [Flavobacterium sp.]|jgi:transcriptional regulator with XRE-family HTH domain
MEDFIKRLEYLLDYYSMSASLFADKIGVQRSSISHLLSGRNKPSLDFVMKIMDVFPDINLYWILNGKGDFLKINEKKELPATPPPPAPEIDFDAHENSEKKIVPETEKGPHVPARIVQDTNNKNEIYKIVIFYKDGTFKAFNNGNDTI